MKRSIHSKGKNHTSYKHGMSKTRLYSTWRAMIGRCDNKACKAYPYYGGRGIKVCRRWYEFSNFYADMGKRQEGMTLERIDNAKGYFPSNVRWATRKEQMNNRRGLRLITFNGVTQNAYQWDETRGFKKGTISSRLRAGWSVKGAVTIPSLGLGRQKAKAHLWKEAEEARCGKRF